MRSIWLSRQKRFGASSEKTDFEQLSLFNEAESESDESLKEPEMVDILPRTGSTKGKKKKGHKDMITKSLPKQVIEYKLGGDDLVCPECGSELHSMKKDVRKELTVIPAKVVVTEHVTYSYSCRNCENNGIEATIIKAPSPAYVFRNSLASPSFIADVLTKKYLHALPLYRQEQELNRNGVMIKRQTLANWAVKASSRYFEPLYALMHEDLLKKDIIMADETTVEVLKEPGRKAQSDSFMWLYRTSGCDSNSPAILFDYRDNRRGECAEEFLSGFKGYLQTDGFGGYNKVIQASKNEGTDTFDVIPVGCMAHARRKYDEAIKAAPKGADLSESPATKGLQYCNALFDLEREADEKGLSFEERRKYREGYARPVFEEFVSWAKDKLSAALPKSKLKDALTYTVNQAVPLGNYMLDGRLEISNNRAERTIKPFVIGRKNWLFANTPKGARASAVIYSLVETAKECGLNVFEYLKYILEELPNADMGCNETLRRYLPYSAEIPERCKISLQCEDNSGQGLGTDH